MSLLKLGFAGIALTLAVGPPPQNDIPPVRWTDRTRVTSRAMARIFASVALSFTAKPETSASGSIANGTPLSVCAPKGGCAGFKIRKLALAVAKQSGGIAPTPPGVNVRPLMWPGELINSERSPGCSWRGGLRRCWPLI